MKQYSNKLGFEKQNIRALNMFVVRSITNRFRRPANSLFRLVFSVRSNLVIAQVLRGSSAVA